MYGHVRGVRFHAVSAVTGCIGMVNVSGVWLTGGLSTEEAHGSEQRLLTRNIGTLKNNTKIHNC